MPKAQKESRSYNHRFTPLAARNAGSSKQPPSSKDSNESKNAADDEKDPTNSSKPREANATSLEASPPQPESASNLLILVTLRGSTNPINRLLSLPPSLTFDKLHHVLQISFGWHNSFVHLFTINLVAPDPRFPDPRPRGPMPNVVEHGVTLASVYLEKDWGHKARITYIHNNVWIHGLAFLGRATPGTNAQFRLPDSVGKAILHSQGHVVAEAA